MTLRTIKNPPRKYSKYEKVEHAIGNHAEVITLVAGILLGFVLGKL